MNEVMTTIDESANTKGWTLMDVFLSSVSDITARDALVASNYDLNNILDSIISVFWVYFHCWEILPSEIFYLLKWSRYFWSARIRSIFR